MEIDRKAPLRGRPWRRAIAILLIAAVMLLVWGEDVLGWMFLASGIGSLAAAVWSARRPGARWLIAVAVALLLWPLVEQMVSREAGWGDAIVVSIALGLVPAINGLWRRVQRPAPWRPILVLASLPALWSLIIWTYVGLSDLIQPDGFGGPGSGSLPRALALLGFLLVALYWAAVAVVTSRVASQSARPTPRITTS